MYPLAAAAPCFARPPGVASLAGGARPRASGRAGTALTGTLAAGVGCTRLWGMGTGEARGSRGLLRPSGWAPAPDPVRLQGPGHRRRGCQGPGPSLPHSPRPFPQKCRDLTAASSSQPVALLALGLGPQQGAQCRVSRPQGWRGPWLPRYRCSASASARRGLAPPTPGGVTSRSPRPSGALGRLGAPWAPQGWETPSSEQPLGGGG